MGCVVNVYVFGRLPMNSVVLLSLIAGLLAVDERAGWQSLLGQPVFASLLVGVVLGEVQTGLAVGAVLELIYLSILPMRGFKRPDRISASIVGAGTAILLINLTADPRFAFVGAVGVFVGLLAGEVGGRLTGAAYGFQNRFLGRATVSGTGDIRQTIRRLRWLQIGSLMYIFVVHSVTVLLLFNVGFYAAERITRYVGGSIVDGAVFWGMLMPTFGAAALINIYWHHHLKRVVMLSAVMMVLVLWLK